MQNNPVTQASLSTRFKVWYESIPIITRYIMTLCVSVYVFGLIFGQYTFELCMSPYMVAYQYEVWRLLPSVFLHGGILHLLFNMMAFIPMGKQLELIIGSTNFFHLIMVFSILSNILTILISLIALYNPLYPYPNFMVQCGIGFSGVIFGLIVIQTQTSRAETQSIFGFFTVPTKYYPWILLIVLQVIMPNVSFLGHLCGILCGYLYMMGYLNGISLSPTTVAKIERVWPMSLLVNKPLFISNPSSGGLGPSRTENTAGSSTGASGNSYLGSMMPRFGSSTPSASTPQNFQGSGRALGSGGASAGEGRSILLNMPPPTAPTNQSRSPGNLSANHPHSNRTDPAPRQTNQTGKATFASFESAPYHGDYRTVEMEPLMAQTRADEAAMQTHSEVSAMQARQMMLDMGFSADATDRALQAANYNIELAIQYLDSER
eukprot:TRINITY_DN2555_c0_g1_i2.p1 TRINITY_DN2555_c0_g1~~TRINITY_DN2555_c0_g1_i2.p1  ORF type:complete len:433 (-),score=89.36 TRINITY_DN2555_c0_g1_i2:215-1513(-)